MPKIAQVNSEVSSVISPSTIQEVKTAHVANRQTTQKNKFSILASGIVSDIKEIKTIKKNTVYLNGTHTDQFYNDTRILDQKFLHMNWGWGRKGVTQE